MGNVESLSNNILTIKADYTPDIGDSIAVNGVCLTVVSFDTSSFSVEIGEETQNLVAIENFIGKVHIEPAMMLSDRLDGHILQGHIDTKGSIKSINKLSNIYEIGIEVPNRYMKYIVSKGSVAVDGVSLTVNKVENNIFYIGVIPHTYQNTIFAKYNLNTHVNIETDIFARYVENILNHSKNTNSWDKIDNITSMY